MATGTSCEMCGERNFELIDGLFYCTNCQTQTQTMHEEQQEEDYEMRSFGLSLKVKQNQTKEKKIVDYGRPWTTYEAFQVIIQKQVKSLLKLGASEKLEEIVFQIWCRYLSKLGVAFTENITSQVTDQFHPRHRDKWLPTREDGKVKNARYLRTLKKSLRLVKKRMPADDLEADTFRDEEFYEGDNPLDQQSDSSDTDTSGVETNLESAAVTDRKSDEDGNKVMCVSHSKHHRVERMCLPLTVCFCYLGLIYVEDLVVPADIVKWIQQEKIPYLNANTLLPKDMKLQNHDRYLFHDSSLDIIKTSRIRILTARLASFLNLKDIPEMNFQILVSRYLVELNLPGDLHALVGNLIHLRTPVLKLTTSTHYEAMAMSYIVVMLKLLLGLDDSTENELSVYSNDLQEYVEQQLFSWSDWMGWAAKKHSLSLKVDLPRSIKDIQQIRNVGASMEAYDKLRKKCTNTVKLAQVRKSMHDETRAALTAPFETMRKTLAGSASQASCAYSDDEDTDMFATPLERTRCTEIDPADEQDFRSSTLAHITQNGDFLNDLDNQGLSDYTLFSTDVGESASSSEELFSGEEFNDTDRTKKKRRKKSAVYAAIHRVAMSKVKRGHQTKKKKVPTATLR